MHMRTTASRMLAFNLCVGMSIRLVKELRYLCMKEDADTVSCQLTK